LIECFQQRQVPNTVETLLGYKPEELENTSWYQWIYPEDLAQARQQHLKFGEPDLCLSFLFLRTAMTVVSI